MKRVFILITLALGYALQCLAQVNTTSNGNVGIGIDDPGTGIKFGVYGQLSKFYYSYNYPLQIDVTGTDPKIESNNKVVFYNLTNNGFIDVQLRTAYEYSDRAAKENIQALNTESALNKIKKLNGVSYQWKGAAAKNRQTGLIAQDVEQVLPDVVGSIDSTGSKMVAYTHIVPYLVEAIKEQQGIIDKLQSQLTRLSETIVRKPGPAISKPKRQEVTQ